jgi:hypothetical protein
MSPPEAMGFGTSVICKLLFKQKVYHAAVSAKFKLYVFLHPILYVRKK